MGTLASAPGVLGASVTTYVTAKDVMSLLGCRDNKAYEIIREINSVALESGKMAYVQGKASKYIFADKFGIPMDAVDAVIGGNMQKRGDSDGIL